MTETIVKKANKPAKEKKEVAEKPNMATAEQLLELQKHFNDNYCNSRK